MSREPGGENTASSTWTVGKMLAWAGPFLTQRGSESGRLDAELLLSEVLQLRRLDLYVGHDRPIEGGELALFKALIKRRANAEPVAYILGRKAFHAIDLEVGPGVLVPRPETEHLVDRVLGHFAHDPPAGSRVDGPIIDVGTGSGAIALAIATALRANDDARTVYGVDVSKDALAYAHRNLEALGLPGVSLGQGDLLGPFAGVGPFAAIVSNPPYIRAARMATLPRTVAAFEPAGALNGGHDGLDMLNRLAALVPSGLVAGGLFAVELSDAAQGRPVVQALSERGMRDARFERIGPGPTGLVIATRAPAEALKP